MSEKNKYKNIPKNIIFRHFTAQKKNNMPKITLFAKKPKALLVFFSEFNFIGLDFGTFLNFNLIFS